LNTSVQIVRKARRSYFSEIVPSYSHAASMLRQESILPRNLEFLISVIKPFLLIGKMNNKKVLRCDAQQFIVGDT